MGTTNAKPQRGEGGLTTPHILWRNCPGSWGWVGSGLCVPLGQEQVTGQGRVSPMCRTARCASAGVPRSAKLSWEKVGLLHAPLDGLEGSWRVPRHPRGCPEERCQACRQHPELWGSKTHLREGELPKQRWTAGLPLIHVLCESTGEPTNSPAWAALKLLSTCGWKDELC